MCQFRNSKQKWYCILYFTFLIVFIFSINIKDMFGVMDNSVPVINFEFP